MVLTSEINIIAISSAVLCLSKAVHFSKTLCAFEVFSAIIFVISRFNGHTTGLVLNTKMKTKSQKVQGNVFSYLGLKYSKTKINFKSILIFFMP
jgi:hypothetical protein